MRGPLVYIRCSSSFTLTGSGGRWFKTWQLQGNFKGSTTKNTFLSYPLLAHCLRDDMTHKNTFSTNQGAFIYMSASNSTQRLTTTLIASNNHAFST